MATMSSTMAAITGLPSKVEPAKIVTVDENGKELSKFSDKRYVELEFQFNPTQLEIEKEVKWEPPDTLVPARNSPDLDFGGGEAATFSLDLLFDTSQDTELEGRDVRKYTNELLKLVMLHGKLSERKPPPRIKFQWGKLTLFLAVVTKVKISYILFHSDGTPARAKASVDFTQFDDSDDYKPSQNPTSRTEARKTHIVEQGETLNLIAYQEYGHSSYWRHIAETNNLLNPKDLRPGQILVVPPIP